MRIRLVCDDDHYKEPPTYVIDIVDGEAQIVREGAPLIDRDRSTTLTVGGTRDRVAIVLRVEALA